MALEYNRVEGRFALAKIDTTSDADDLPDVVPLVDGIVRFVPNSDMDNPVEPSYLEDGTPIPRLLLQRPIEARIDASGRLIDGAGHTYVKLIDLTSDQLNPRLDEDSMTHTVVFEGCRTADGEIVNIPSKPVSISGPGPHHLPSLLPVMTTSGEAVTVGPAGPGVDEVFIDPADRHLKYRIVNDDQVYDAGSLVGVIDADDAYEVWLRNGNTGTEDDFLASLVGAAGKSAYQQAVDAGFSGTLAQWLASLAGVPGKSAYQLAVDAGFSGTEAQWRTSLKGDQGDPGIVVVDRGVGTAWSTGSMSLVDTVLITPPLPVGRYLFEADLLVSRSSTSATVNVAIGGTHASGFAKAVMIANGSSNAAEAIIVGKSSGQSVPGLSSSDTSNVPVRIKGHLQVTTAGTVALQISVSTGTVTLETGSTMSLRGNLVAV